MRKYIIISFAEKTNKRDLIFQHITHQELIVCSGIAIGFADDTFYAQIALCLVTWIGFLVAVILRKPHVIKVHWIFEIVDTSRDVSREECTLIT